MSPESTITGLASARGARAEAIAAVAVRHADDTSLLNQLLQAASLRLDVPGVNLSVLTDRQITVAGRTPDGTPAEVGAEIDFADSMCVNALRTDEPLAIPNTLADPRVSSIPAVSDGPVRSYLGSAIRTDEGVVAVLCVYDVRPRRWSGWDVAQLEELAAEVRNELLRLATTSEG